MNTSFFKLMVSAVALPLFVGPALASPEGNIIQAPPVAQTLRGVQPMEMPAKAAALVSQTSVEARTAVAIEVVHAVASVNPAVTHLVVGAMAKVSPEVAGAAAGAAAWIQPQDLARIARSAAKAAPGEAVGIVSALCKARPEYFDVAAAVVSQTVAGQDEEILRALSLAVPSLKFALDQAYAEVSRNNKQVSVQKVVSRAKSYAKWDMGRNEYVDIGGVYRNSISLGLQAAPASSLAALETTPVGSSLYSSSLYKSGAAVLPKPPVNGSILYYYGGGGTLDPGGAVSEGGRDYSAP